MSKRRQLYGGRVPKDYLPAHNHVKHVPNTSHGERGFRRFWIPPQWAGKGWSKCPCEWGSQPSTREPECWPEVHGWYKRDKGRPHYAWTGHVKVWREAIKKHGGIEGAHRQFIKELSAYERE